MGTEKSAPLDRLVAVLSQFAARDEWGVREMADATGISPTAAHRILHEMRRLGLLAQGRERGRFRIGPDLARFAVLIAERIDLRAVARPILIETSRDIDETVILTLYSPERRAFWAIDAIEAPHPIRYIWESLRTWSDLQRGASGKGILAFLDAAEREAILDDLLEPERSRLSVDLEATIARGYAISHGERFAGAVGVSAPIRDATGGVIGDVVVGWPDNRNSDRKEEAVAAAVIRAARRVSEALGYRGG
jgi:DNA-binding IclR family transcriptional regulator